MIGAPEIKAARALLGINQLELSQMADVAVSTVKRLELAADITGSARTLWKLQTALERAGVEFIPADDQKGPGVRLRKRTRTKVGRSRSG
jgi:transcriptional regulator with XRE-family HTH domain